MYSNEQYIMYELANNLVANNEYKVIYLDDVNDDIWLEKHVGKVSKVIRLSNKGFDWSNHLKADIARVFQKTVAMKQLLSSRMIEIHNIYISARSPVDDWDILKKPMQLNEKNPPKMKNYYIDEVNLKDELVKLESDLDAALLTHYKSEQSESMKEEYIIVAKAKLAGAQLDREKATKGVFTFGKPFMTYILILINILMFIIVETNGGSADLDNLIRFGAKYNPAIIDGQWWRIGSATFLHIGMLHIAMNMFALYYLGRIVEQIYGSWRFTLVYILAGIGGGLASFAFTMNVSAGASGAIFGLFGALLFFGLIYKKLFFETMGKGLLMLIAINIVFGFLMPQIDNGAHIGGLITGFFASAIFHLPGKKHRMLQFSGFIIYIAIISSLVIYGTGNDMNQAIYQLTKTEEMIKVKDYETAIINATNGLKKPSDFEAELLFQRSYAYIELNETDLAIVDLEHSIKLNDEFAEAYYNLAILYFDAGYTEKSEDAITIAYELNPEAADFKQLYEKIIGETNP